MDEFDRPALVDYLRSILDEGIPGLLDLTDLVSVWRSTPEDELDWDDPGGLTRQYAILCDYINESENDPIAWEALRTLLRELFEKREDIPDPLVFWGLYQVVRGKPPPRYGRPLKTNRNFYVLSFAHFLWSGGLSERASAEIIADVLSTDEDIVATETVRSIFRKYRTLLPPW